MFPIIFSNLKSLTLVIEYNRGYSKNKRRIIERVYSLVCCNVLPISACIIIGINSWGEDFYMQNNEPLFLSVRCNLPSTLLYNSAEYPSVAFYQFTRYTVDYMYIRHKTIQGESASFPYPLNAYLTFVFSYFPLPLLLSIPYFVLCISIPPCCLSIVFSIYPSSSFLMPIIRSPW